MASSEEPPLIPDQRRELLVKHLRREGVLSVQQITQLFGVSHMTVRRDIAELESQGLVFSVPGGVRIANQLHSEPSFQAKSQVEQPEKRAMAGAAAELVHDGMTVYLDAGTTLLAMVPHLTEREGLTVVTNDFGAVERLFPARQVTVIHVGGQVEPDNHSSVGRLAAATIRQLAFDLAFISTSSWDLLRGVTTPSEAKVEVKQAAMAAASQSVLVAGSSKYGTFGMYKVAALSAFDTVLTDAALTEPAAQGIRAAGADLRLITPER
ncbi:DeoR/GlpR family DNA-binding transcription regulator [Streptomyces sp. NBC_01186]|uniref:DeoR/GlpR family DNA-binding transcription regulator n=1 Tax=unclassified Streptomyces TaxID=2593676 RepID=UPI002DDBA6A9|nr:MULTISPECIES: DeoR/GlpR family DNA-binding transcription regulator [unclassified Streptomyces]WSB80382.1 DeoR/GlpR family DNA-binding transcription regulator [Streptomyces sp. NBC_01775]WSS11413.1 DeoR/GlpR family DNA-binding transcription regulator [Streptomyces sp. NBC_01186]